jgi:hypothetical protein
LIQYKGIVMRLLLCIFLFISESVFSIEINRDNYEIYVGDLNSDGKSDFYFKAKKNTILIHGDIAIPILVSKGLSFVIYRSGTGYKPPIEIQSALTQLFDEKIKAGTIKYAVIDTNFNVISSSSIRLNSRQIGVWDLILNSSYDSALPSVSVIESIVDHNTPPDLLSAVTSWKEVISGMMNNDPYVVDKYFTISSISRYKQSFLLLNNQLSDIANQLGMVQFLSASENRAIFLVEKQNDDFITYVHAVEFVKDAAGNWKVEQL